MADTVRFLSPRRCSRCGGEIAARVTCLWDSETKEVTHVACPRSKEERAQVQADRVTEITRSLVSLFEAGDLPEKVALTVIHRVEQDVPSARWSPCNRMLMLLAGTTDARGYRQWREVGRYPLPGTHAFYILAPRIVRVREDDDESDEDRETSRLAGFLAVPVFRVEDTGGTPLPPPPDYRPAKLPVLSEVAERWHIPIEWLPFEGRYRGVHMGLPDAGEKIVLYTHDERTFFHELAHAAHARVLRARGKEIKGGQDPHQEIVAELTAATICKMYGYEGYLAHSREYIASYAGSKGLLRAMTSALSDVEACLSLILGLPEVKENRAA